jgi:hypothetical protein
MGMRLGSLHSEKNINSAFENGAVRRIFVLTREEVRAGGRNLLYGELHYFHPSLYVVRTAQLRRFSWVAHALCMEVKKT